MRHLTSLVPCHGHLLFSERSWGEEGRLTSLGGHMMRGLRIGRRRIRAMLSTSSGHAKPKIASKSRYRGMG